MPDAKLLSRSAAPQYPGHYLSRGGTDRESIRIVQQRLNMVGCGPVDGNGIFGRQTEAASSFFKRARSIAKGSHSRLTGRMVEKVIGTFRMRFFCKRVTLRARKSQKRRRFPSLVS